LLGDIITQKAVIFNMTKYKAWKNEERVIAKAFNTERALGLGSDEKSDIISDVFVVDAKVRKTFSLKWFNDLVVYADKKGKIPILTYRQSDKRQRVAVVKFDTLISLLKASGHITEQGGGVDNGKV
jgi:hypothetical protein